MHSALLSLQHGIDAYVSERGIQAAKKIRYFFRPRGKRAGMCQTIRCKLYYPSEAITNGYYIISTISPVKTVVGNR